MTDSDQRPPMWVGHISLTTPRLDDTHAFMLQIGMRAIAKGTGFAVLELRAGTHLVLMENADAKPGEASFDLMVEDIDASHAQLRQQGLAPSPIADGKIHRSFSVEEPCGNVIKFNSSHNSGLPV
jgi:hypothetical protein